MRAKTLTAAKMEHLGMRELTSVVLEMERQSKRLRGLLRVGRLNTMTRTEFNDLVAIADRLMVNLTDFNGFAFWPQVFGGARV